MKCFACGTSDPTFEKVVGDAVEVKLSKFWLLRGVQIADPLNVPRDRSRRHHESKLFQSLFPAARAIPWKTT